MGATVLDICPRISEDVKNFAKVLVFNFSRRPKCLWRMLEASHKEAIPKYKEILSFTFQNPGDPICHVSNPKWPRMPCRFVLSAADYFKGCFLHLGASW